MFSSRRDPHNALRPKALQSQKLPQIFIFAEKLPKFARSLPNLIEMLLNVAEALLNFDEILEEFAENFKMYLIFAQNPTT